MAYTKAQYTPIDWCTFVRPTHCMQTALGEMERGNKTVWKTIGRVVNLRHDVCCSGLTKMSNSWFYVNVCERFNRFGGAKVVRSLNTRECESGLHHRNHNKHPVVTCSCEAGDSPDEARLEQTPYPFQPQIIWRYLGIK